MDTIHAVIEQYQHRRGRPGHGDQFSPREQEVAGPVIQGRASREIAENLVRLATAVPAPRPYESRWPRARMRLMSMT